MNRFTTVTACLALSLPFAVGCEKAADEQHKADQARTDADQKVDQANREASDKVNAARADADKEVAEAQANFQKLREDYRHKVTESLVTTDKSIADLEAKAKTAKAKEKTTIDAALPNVRSLRESVMTEYRSLDLSSAVTWDDSKGRVDKAIDDLKKAIDKAD
jgi:vacuolar-type H+-ATPase subunit H